MIANVRCARVGWNMTARHDRMAIVGQVPSRASARA